MPFSHVVRPLSKHHWQLRRPHSRRRRETVSFRSGAPASWGAAKSASFDARLRCHAQLRVLQVYYKCTTSVLQVYYKCTTSVLQVYYKCTAAQQRLIARSGGGPPVMEGSRIHIFIIRNQSPGGTESEAVQPHLSESSLSKAEAAECKPACAHRSGACSKRGFEQVCYTVLPLYRCATTVQVFYNCTSVLQPYKCTSVLHKA
jgi:hypothetical protein